LLAATTDIIIADTVELLLIFALDWLTFVEEHCVRRHNAIFARVDLNNFELYCLEASTD
jgi:hypothetical protein